MPKIKYNSQRDNFTFAGKFKAWWQCFTTSSWMFMSFFTNKIDATDDKGLSIYLDDVEASVGKPGIAERVRKKISWIPWKGSSYWWVVQQEGINKWLWKNNVKGIVVFVDGMPFEQFVELQKHATKNGPIIIGTKKLGGLRGGHIILCVDKEKYHDPFGNAHTNYKDRNGESVKYSNEYIIKYTGKKVRCIYWKR